MSRQPASLDVLRPTPAAEPDEQEPSAARQAELEAAHEANVAAATPPYAGVHVRTRGELAWILARCGRRGRHDAYTVKYVLIPHGLAYTSARPDTGRYVGLRLARNRS